MVKIKEIQNYKNYGACVSISNEKIELLVTVDIGPRIIYLAHHGKENMMFNDVDRKISHDVSSLYGDGSRWYIYGGHRLWVSPEAFPLTYYPDNDKVIYEYLPNGVLFQPPVQKETGLAYKITVTMDDNEPKVQVIHEITNTLQTSVTGAAWGLTVMDAGGMIIAPLNSEDTGFLPNRHIVLWPYTHFSDSRLCLGDEYIGLKHNSRMNNPIKLSFNNMCGKLAYVNHNQAFIKSFKISYGSSLKYPDFDTNCEFYSCKDFTEAESLSPLYTLNNGESLTHAEEWTLLDDVEMCPLKEKDIKELAKK